MATVKPRPSRACQHPTTDDPCETCSWRVLWRLGGRAGRMQSCTFATRKLAEAANALCLSRRHRITDEEVYKAIHGVDDSGLDGVPTLAELADSWISRRRRGREVEAGYLNRVEWIMRHRVIPHLGKLRVTNEQITPDTISDWVATIASQPGPKGELSAATVREAHVALHGLLQSAVPRWLQYNPAAVKDGKRRKSGLPKLEHFEATFLTPDEIKLILAACDAETRDMVEMALLTGLRLGELLPLTVEDVTLTGKHPILRVRRALKKDGTIREPKSRSSLRSQRVSKRCAAILQRRTEGKPPSALVFPAPKGKIWDRSRFRNRRWWPTVAAAQRCPLHPPPEPPKPTRGPRRKWRADEISDCPCESRLHRKPRWHDLRHTAVSIRVEEGWDITRVSRWIGHESVSTTINIYGHLWEPEGDDRVDELDRYVLLEEDEEA